MSIKPENLKTLESLELRMKDQLMWVGRSRFDQLIQTTNQLRALMQFTIGLSIAIVAVVYPLVLSTNESRKNEDIFSISIFLFSYVVVYGMLKLILPIVQETKSIPDLSKKHADAVLEIIKEIQEIKKIENNDEAGKRLQALQSKVRNNKTEIPVPKFLLWRRFEIHIFFATFIVGYIFLIFGLKNLF